MSQLFSPFFRIIITVGFIYIYAFSRHLSKATYSASRLYMYCQYVCSLGIEPKTFALRTQCSTTEPQEHWFHMLNTIKGKIWFDYSLYTLE